MDPFAEFIHPDAPWDDALAQLLGDGTSWPSTSEPFADSVNPGFAVGGGDLFAGFHGGAGFGFEEYHQADVHNDASPSAGSVGTHAGTMSTSAPETSYTMSPSESHNEQVRVKGEGSTEGEVGWGVVGEGWGVAPGLLGIPEPMMGGVKMPFVPEVVEPVVRNASPAVLPPPPSAKLHNKVRLSSSR